MNNKIRYGRNKDGGYVIADGLDYDLFIAGGICDDTSFEEQFLGIHDVPAYAYEKPPPSDPAYELETHQLARWFAQ